MKKLRQWFDSFLYGLFVVCVVVTMVFFTLVIVML